MSSMDNVIYQLRNGKYIEAIKEYRATTGALLKPSKDAVDALRPYLDPSCPEYVHKPQQPSESIPEAIPEKDPIDKWAVTCLDPYNRDWKHIYTTEKAALKAAQDLCNGNCTQVTISRVIAEAKEQLTYSIKI